MTTKYTVDFFEKYNIIMGFSNVLLTSLTACLRSVNIFWGIKVYFKWNKLIYFNKLLSCMIVYSIANG